LTEAEAQGADDADLAAALASARAQQAAVSDILRVISRSSKDLQAVFDVIATSARRFCSAEDAMVALVEGDRLIGKAHDGAVEWVVGSTPLDRQLPAARCIVDGRAIHVHDMQTDSSDDYRIAREIAKKYGIHTVLATPMFHDGRAVGSITLRRTEVRPFTEEQIELVHTFADQAVIAIENVRLFNETKDALDQQTATADVLKTISRSAFDLQAVFDVVVENATKLCRGEWGYLFRREGDVFRLIATHGGTPALIEYERAHPTVISDRTLLGRVALRRGVVHIPDLFDDPDYDWPSNREHGVHTVLGVPIFRGDEVIGAIGVARNERSPFSDADIRLVQTFADQATIAMENVRLFNETKEALGQQTALSDVLRTISRSAFDLDAVLQTIVERAAALVGAEGAAITRREGDEAVVLAQYGSMLPASQRPGTRIPVVQRTAIGRAILTRKRQYIADAAEDPDLSQSGPRTRLVIPFLRDGTAIGTLGVTHNLPRPFSDRELQMLETFADQAAIAIENVRLFNETKESLERQTALAEILSVIADSPADEQPVVDAVARSTTRYCGAEDAAVFLLEGEVLRRVAHHGVLPVVSSPILPLERGAVAGRAILERRTVHVADVAGVEGDDFLTTRARAAVTGQRGTLATPMLREGAPIGVILLRKMEPSGFTPSQIQLVEAFADQAVIAIENVRLFNETKEALDRQSATAEVLKVMSDSPFELEPVLRSLVETAARLCDADRCVIFRREGDVLRVAAVSAGANAEIIEAYRDNPLHLDRTTITGRAVMDGQTVHLPDASADPTIVMLQEREPYLALTGGKPPEQVRQRSGLSVPLIREAEVIGAFTLWRHTVRPFSAREIELIETFARQAVIAIENVRLFNETKETLKQLTATSEILRVISETLGDPQPVMQAIVDTVLGVCSADSAGFFRRSGDDLILRAVSGTWRGPGPSGIGQHRAFYGDSIVVSALEERRSQHVTDTSADPRYDATAQWSRTRLAVPVLRGSEALGVIRVGRSAPGGFSAREIDLVEGFAEQAAIAFENARLFNETKEALERQTSISDVLQTIGRSAFDLQPVLDTVVERAVKLCDAREGSISTLEDDVYRTRAYWSASSLPQAYIDFMREEVRTPERGSLTGRTALEGRVVHIADVLEDAEYTATDMQKAAGYRTLLGVPLLRDGRVIGVFALTRSEVRPFSDRQIELVRTFADQAAIAIENTRLFVATKEALEQQTAVGEVLKTISRSAFDLQPVLDIVVNNAVRLAGADIGWMSRVENERFLTVSYSSEFPQSVLDELARQRADGHLEGPWIPLGTGGGLMGFTLSEGRTVHLPDVKEDPDLKGSVVARLTASRTVVGVPMLRDGRTIGGMVLARYEVRPFAERELELVQTFADQAAIAIENVRLFNETKESLDRQTAVAQVLGEISRSGFQLQPVLESVIEAATKLCAAQQGFIYRREGGMFRLVVAHGITPEFKAFTEANPINPMGRGTVTGRVVEDRKTVHIPDVLGDTEYTYWEAQKLGDFRAILGVPMVRDEEVIGVMLLWRTEPQPFTDDQIALVTTFANQATIAIENVRLFDETKEALEQQTAVGDVLKTISRSAFDLNPVLSTVVENAARLSDADLGWMGRLVQVGMQDNGGPVRWTRDGDMTVFAPYDEYLREAGRGQAVGPGRPGSIMARAFTERRTVHVEDITVDDELFRESMLARTTGSRTVLAVPLLVEGSAIGTMIVARRVVRRFSDREVQVVETFADQAAIAIQNVRLFNQIEQKSRELEVASRHKSEFLANMSHELRTPLNAIIGFSEVLIQGLFGEVNEKQREYLQDVIGSGQHLLSLINDILDLSKIEAGRMELELSTFSFPSALQSGVTIVRERAARHGISLNVDVSDELGQVEADERKVKQILYNLLSNAVKFTPDGGNVNVTVRRDNGAVRVDVRDNGIGIAEADQARIFEEFQQVGRERSREGTGLGLTLTKRFVELHGGRIWLESAPGRGSTFTFTLPLRQAAPVRA
jgi:GAF domain-containing protein/two-component sensor histidine kinase